MAWLLLLLSGQALAAFAPREPAARRAARARVQKIVAAEHAALALALASGYAVTRLAGLSLARGTLGLKLGLVLFLVLPLEAMHAYVAHGWIARGLHGADAESERLLERGLGIESMLRTIGVPLFGLGLPIILWLSLHPRG